MSIQLFLLNTYGFGIKIAQQMRAIRIFNFSKIKKKSVHKVKLEFCTNFIFVMCQKVCYSQHAKYTLNVIIVIVSHFALRKTFVFQILFKT